ncbi:XRE family transcriptional regulator [Salana multivorans]|uniref:XRE family transcriptional regulator n=1 Tax=Salana multivorans TaxID=120377 RepID=A0A3N2D802_9MICO|nr:XRE family transcriptional regulator [Salana multivorans]
MGNGTAAVARNVQRLRADRGLTLAVLAERSGVAKGTISELERGRGNPTVETLFALAYALDATLADLVEEEPPAGVQIVRAAERPPIPGQPLDARLLQRSRHTHVAVETYDFSLHANSDHHAKAHRPGTREHAYVLSGEADVGPESAHVRLGPGDYANYPADVPHVYRSAEGAQLFLIMLVPTTTPPSP